MADLTVPEVPEMSRFGTAGIPGVPDLPIGIGNREGSGTDVAAGRVRAIARARLAMADTGTLMCAALAEPDTDSARALVQSLQHFPAFVRTHTLPVIDAADSGLRDIEHAQLWTELASEMAFGFHGGIQTPRVQPAVAATLTPKHTHSGGA